MENKRRKNSGGQALVMVTLALMAMAGLMGLAVDLGWSYFVQKEAQAAADGAALAAAQEAMIQITSAGIAVTAFTCGSVMNVDCQTTVKPCGQIGSSSNLNNGCLYAKANGFDYTQASSRQNVTIQSNDHSTLPPTAPGVNNIAYWVTARTVQAIPQLFSAVLGNTLGTVSAVATAGIVGSVQPGSFFGMNHKGDCLTGSLVPGPDCGLDLQIGGSTGTTCVGAPGGIASVCAPAGIILSSQCNGTFIAGQCSGSDGAYAGTAKGSSSVYGSSLVVMAPGAVGTSGSGSFSPSSPTSAPSTSSLFQDPTQGKPQPPLQAPSSPMGSCGYNGGVIPSTVTQLGPFQYYSFTPDSNGNPIPDGKPIVLPPNVTFSSGITSCQGTGVVATTGATPNSALPAYIFWGGMITQNSVNFGPGQYVMAGTASAADGATVFNASNGSGTKGSGTTITGDSATGTMFIFTDGSYPGLQATSTSPGQLSGIPNQSSMPLLYQGSINIANSDITLTGLVNSNNGSNLPPGMDAYSGVAWWQDRRNSTVEYNKDYAKDYPNISSPACIDCKKDDGTVVNCGDCGSPPSLQTAAELTENHVTPTSPGVVLQDGGANLNIRGVWYQPRGAWLQMEAGTAGVSGTKTNPQVPLQIITGALICDTGCGNTGVILAGPTNPLIRYKVSLIQ